MEKQKSLFIAGAFNLGPGKKKFERGVNPCYYCGKGDHPKCRGVKLDCTVCSCYCSYASDTRSEIEAQQVSAKDSGAVIPSPLQCLQNVRKTTVKRFLQ